MTRGLAAGPERFEGRSRYNSLSPRGRPSGVSAAGAGPTAMILKGPVKFSESFSSRTLLSAPFRNPGGYGGGVINPNPSAGRILGAAEEGIGEGGVAPIYPSDGEGVLFSYKFVRTLLGLTSKVAVGELVAIEVLMYTTI